MYRVKKINEKSIGWSWKKICNVSCWNVLNRQVTWNIETQFVTVVKFVSKKGLENPNAIYYMIIIIDFKINDWESLFLFFVYLSHSLLIIQMVIMLNVHLFGNISNVQGCIKSIQTSYILTSKFLISTHSIQCISIAMVKFRLLAS